MVNTFAIAFAIYVVAMILMGMRARKRSNDSESFAASKGDINVYSVAMAFAASYMSAGCFLGLPGMAFNYGLTIFTYWGGVGATACLSVALIAKAYRRVAHRVHASSIADWIGTRFNSQFMRVWLIIVSILQIVFISAQLVGVGLIFQNMLGISYQLGVVIGAAVVIVYICLGGSYAHVYANTVQGTLMCALGIFILLTGFFLFGDAFTAIPEKLAAIDPALVQPFNPANASWPTMLHAVGIYVAMMCWGLNPQLIGKVQMLKSRKDMRRFLILSVIFCWLCMAACVGGLIGRVLIPEGMASPLLTTSDGAVPAMMSLVYPKSLAMVFNLIIITATMSTIDGIVLYLSSLAGNTIYKDMWVAPRIKRGMQYDMDKVEKKSMRICRYAIVLVGVLSIPIAVSRPGNLTLLIWFSSGSILSAVAGPVFAGVFMPKCNKKAAVIGSVVAVVVFMFILITRIDPSVFLCTGIGAVVSIVVTFVVGLILPAETDAKVIALMDGIKDEPAFEEDRVLVEKA